MSGMFESRPANLLVVCACGRRAEAPFNPMMTVDSQERALMLGMVARGHDPDECSRRALELKATADAARTA